jgi:hypothetical protein
MDELPKQNQDWTPAEAKLLVHLAIKRVCAERAARVLGRRVGSVRRQARTLGILLYKDEVLS